MCLVSYIADFLLASKIHSVYRKLGRESRCVVKMHRHYDGNYDSSFLIKNFANDKTIGDGGSQ